MQLTTENIIKFLPFEEAFKNELLSRLDTLPLERKAALERLLWDSYYAIYELKLQENLQIALEESRNGKGNLDKEFYKRVVEKTNKKMEQEATQLTTQVDLAQTREELKEIINKPQS